MAEPTQRSLVTLHAPSLRSWSEQPDVILFIAVRKSDRLYSPTSCGKEPIDQLGDVLYLVVLIRAKHSSSLIASQP
jgi:hypothetical protein